MSDETDVAIQLENMMSHGIFDSEAVANAFRVKGWKFVVDPELDTNTGGGYVVRSPGGRQGLVNWYNKESINSLTENAAFFVDDEKAPPRMFLAWIFADQMGRLILNSAFDENPDGTENPPGITFENAYLAFKNSVTASPHHDIVPPAILPEPTEEATAVVSEEINPGESASNQG